MKKIYALACILLCLPLVGCGKTKVPLNDYLTITTEGYDTDGKAYAQIDSESFEDVFYGKIKDRQGNPVEVRIFLADCVGGELDKSSQLSNGDTIVFKWNCRDKKAEVDYNVELVYSDYSYQVNNLTLVESFNPFNLYDRITYVKGEGIISPPKYDNIYLESVHLRCDENQDFSVGNSVTVTASGSDYLVEKYGICVNPTEAKYEVVNNDDENIVTLKRID